MKTAFEFSVGTRKCLNCGDKIKKGTSCMRVYGGFGRNSYSGNFCRKCLLQIAVELTRMQSDGVKVE